MSQACMIFKFDLDPLDRELMERALDSICAAMKGSEMISDYESDEELEAALRCELIGIVRENAVGDAETMRDVVLATISRKQD